MRRLTTGILSEKCVVRRFRRRENVIGCTYTSLDSIAYYMSGLLLLDYKPVQHVTVLNTVGNCNTVLSIVMLYCNIIIRYNLTGPPSYVRSVVDRNVVMRRMNVKRANAFACARVLVGNTDQVFALLLSRSLRERTQKRC